MNHLLECLLFGILANFAIERSFWRSHRECVFVVAMSLPNSATILTSSEIKTLNFGRIASVDEESRTECLIYHCDSSMNFKFQA